MLPEDIQEIVLQHLRVPDLWPGFQHIDYENRELQVFVQYIWVAVIDFSEMKSIVMAATRMNRDKSKDYHGLQRNVIWLHAPEPKGIRRRVSIKVVELDVDEPDSVADALTSMNMIPLLSTVGLDALEATYEVFTFTWKGRGYFKYEGQPQSPNMRVFWDALVEKAKYLAAATGDKEIQYSVEFLNLMG